MNDHIFPQPELGQPATEPAKLATQPANYLRPEIAELGRTEELIQGGSFGGYPDNYTGYRKEYW